MTEQLVNVGVAPNTGTGDFLRVAFQKINSNFEDLYGSNIFNVRQFEAVGDNVADDTASFAATVTAAVAAWNLTLMPQVVYIPAGIYKITSNFINGLISANISFIGDGSLQSILNVSKIFSGDLFPFSNIWTVGLTGVVFPSGGNVANFAAGLRAGVKIKGLGITGDRTSSNTPNLFAFYDSTDYLDMSDIMVEYWPGRVIWGGIMNTTTRGCIRESHFSGLRFFNSGNTNCPVIDIDSNSTGSLEGSNELRFRDIEIYAPYGDGFSMRGQTNGTGGVLITNIRIEGREAQFGTLTGDLMRIGNINDGVGGSQMSQIQITNAILLNPYPNYAALRITKPVGGTYNPFKISFQGGISATSSSTGEGIHIDAGRYFRFSSTCFMAAGKNSLNIGPASGGIVGPIYFEDAGDIAGWTLNVDATSSAFFLRSVNNQNITADML